MKKAGIITFYNADNFGAVLQCYALQKHLQSIDINAFVLDTKDEAIFDFYKSFKLTKSIKGLIINCIRYPHNVIRHNKFNDFRNKYFNIQSYSSDCDMWVSGSDQVWNFKITNGFNPVYFADFDDEAFKISYAASIGKEFFSDEENQVFKNELSKLQMISVREEKAKELISPLTEKEISVVPDPTLLLNCCDWESILPHNKPKEKYLLIYNLCESKGLYDIAYKISNELDLPIIEIRGSSKPLRKIYKHKIYDDIGPIDFLDYIHNAEFVVTDSFHGTVFSVIFKKNFYTVPPTGLGSRMRTLLNKLDLPERLITALEQVNSSACVDFKDVDSKLSAYAADGKAFLSKAIKRL